MATRRKPLSAQAKQKISQALKGKKKRKGGASTAKKKMSGKKKAAITAGVAGVGLVGAGALAAKRYGKEAKETASDIAAGGYGKTAQRRGAASAVRQGIARDAKNLGKGVTNRAKAVGAIGGAVGRSAANKAGQVKQSIGAKADKLEQRGREVTAQQRKKRQKRDYGA